MIAPSSEFQLCAIDWHSDTFEPYDDSDILISSDLYPVSRSFKI